MLLFLDAAHYNFMLFDSTSRGATKSLVRLYNPIGSVRELFSLH
jgi:hypothetical protein